MLSLLSIISVIAYGKLIELIDDNKTKRNEHTYIDDGKRRMWQQKEKKEKTAKQLLQRTCILHEDN